MNDKLSPHPVAVLLMPPTIKKSCAPRGREERDHTNRVLFKDLDLISPSVCPPPAASSYALP
jgi:hypothetical protein